MQVVLQSYTQLLVHQVLITVLHAASADCLTLSLLPEANDVAQNMCTIS